MKLLIVRVFVLVIRILYTPMKLRKVQNKIVWLSRQSDKKSQDMEMLSNEIAHLSPDTKQVFRLRRLKDESALSISYILGIFGDMWEIASARVAICDTYSIPLSCLNHKGNLKIVQIWHALGAVKKFSLQSVGKSQGRDSGVSKVLCMHKNYDYVIAPSKKTAEFYCEAFGCNEDKIFIANLPRVDVILDGTSRREEFTELNPEYKYKKIIAYLPTFRNDDDKIIERLHNVFENENDVSLVISAHPLSKVSENYKYNGNFGTYDLMKLADEIITDYSACAFEASLLSKPLWFYIPDYETYKEEQGLNTDMPKILPNACFFDENKLLCAIKSGEYDLEKLDGFSRVFVEKRGNNNTNYLAEFICRLI